MTLPLLQKQLNQAQASTLMSGNFGGISYVLDSSGQLTISSYSKSTNYSAGVIPSNAGNSSTFYPWSNDARVTSMVFTSGSSYSTLANANYLFANMPNLTSITTNNDLNMTATPMAFNLFTGDTALAATQAAKASGTTSSCAAVAAVTATTTTAAQNAILASSGVNWSVASGVLTIAAGTLPTNTNDDPTFWPWYDNSAVTKIVVGGAAAGGAVSTSNEVSANLSIAYLYANMPNLTTIQSTNGTYDYFNGILSGTAAAGTLENINDAGNIMINDPELNLSPVIGTTGSTTETTSMATISGANVTLKAVAQANNATDDPTFYPWYGSPTITSFSGPSGVTAAGPIVASQGGIQNITGTQATFSSDGSFVMADFPNLTTINNFIGINLVSGPADESFIVANDQFLTGDPSTGASSKANVNAYWATANTTAANIVGGNGMMWMAFDTRGNGGKTKTISLNGLMQNDASLTSFYATTNQSPSGTGCVFDMNSMFQGNTSLIAVNLGGGFTPATSVSYAGLASGDSSLQSFTGLAGTTATDMIDLVNAQVSANGGTNNNTSSTTVTATVSAKTSYSIYAGQTFTPGSNLLVAIDTNSVAYTWPNSALSVAYCTTSTGTFSAYVAGGSSATALDAILPSTLFNTSSGIATNSETFYVKYELTVSGSVVATSTAEPVTITANQASLTTTTTTTLYTGSTAAASFAPLNLVATATDYTGTSVNDSSHVVYSILNSASTSVSSATMLSTPGTYTILFSLFDTTGNAIVNSSGTAITATSQVVIRANPTLTFSTTSDASVVIQKGGTYVLPSFSYTGYSGETSGLKVVETAITGSGTTLNTSNTGTYYLVYTLEDSAGNTLYDSSGSAVTIQQKVVIDSAMIKATSPISIGNNNSTFDPLSLVTATDAYGNSVASSSISYTYTLSGTSTVSGTQSDFATNYASWLGSSNSQVGTMTFTYSYTDTATNSVLTTSATVNVLKDATIFQTSNGTSDNTLGPTTSSSWNPLVLVSKITDSTGATTLYSSTVGSGTVPPTSLSSAISYSISDTKGLSVANVTSMLSQAGTYNILFVYKDADGNSLSAVSTVVVNEGLFLDSAPSITLAAASQTITGTPITVNGSSTGNLTVINDPATSNGWSLNASLSAFTGTDSSSTVWTLSNTTLDFTIANSQTVTNGPTIETVNGTAQSSLTGDGSTSTLISAPGSTGTGSNVFTFSSPSLLISGSDLYNIEPSVNYSATITWTIADSATTVK